MWRATAWSLPFVSYQPRNDDMRSWFIATVFAQFFTPGNWKYMIFLQADM
jgi:hypothetical protein